MQHQSTSLFDTKVLSRCLICAFSEALKKQTLLMILDDSNEYAMQEYF